MKTYRIFATVVLAMGLAACLHDDDENPPSGPSPTGTTTGSATKGIIRNAVVEMDQFNSSGQAVNIGTGSPTTDASGNYSVNYAGYAGGPVQVCVRGKTAAEATATPPATTVVCDATDGPACGPSPTDDRGAGKGDVNDNGTYDLGEAITVDQNFEICTCLPAPPTSGVRAPITPFTDLVVQRAVQREADAALNESLLQALLNAASEVNQLTGGLDVLRQEPINLADSAARAAASPDELVYSALLAATIGQSADGATGPVDLTAVIAALRTEAGDGTFSFSAIRDLIAEAQQQLLIVGGDESGRLEALGTQVDEAEASGASNFDTTPSTSAESSRITRAKNLVANVRDTINGLNELEAPADAFGTQVEMAAALLDPADTDNGDGTTTPVLGPVDFLFEGLVEVLGAAAFCVEDNTTEDGSGNETTADATCSDAYTVKGTYPTERDAEIAGYKATFADFPATISVASGQVTAGIAGNDENVNANLTAVFPNNAGRATAQTLNASFTGAVSTTPTGTGLQLSIPSPGATAVLTKTGSVALDDNDDATDDGKRISSASFSMPNITLAQIRTPAEQAGGPVSFTGALGAAIVRCTTQSCVTRENAAPSADPDDGQATFSPSAFNLSGTFSNTDNSTAMSVTISVANAASFDPDLNAGTDGDTLTATNFPDATVTLRFDAALGEVAPAQAVLSGDLNGIFVQPETCSGCSPGATHSDPNATATLTLLRGSPLAQVLHLQANTVDDGNFTGVEATVTDSDNASLALDFQGAETDTNGIVRVDGVQVGEIRELSTGLIIVEFDDGTFETLF